MSIDEKKAEKAAKKAAQGKKKDAPVDQSIFVLRRAGQPDGPYTVGELLTEIGRRADAEIADGVSVVDEWKRREAETHQMLKLMEDGDAVAVALWQKTRQWSLDEFKRIYSWLDCRFDVDFFESEVSEPSKHLVQQHYEAGRVFIKDDGAIGADLKQYNLGFAMVLKRNGTGLYLTKDLALAQTKFDKFLIDESIYVVDAAQSMHFQQCFKVLELLGYEQAKRCKHLPYGLVVLPDGKMSSRKGNVILFSQLREQLRRQINADFLSKYELAKPIDELIADAEKVVEAAAGNVEAEKQARTELTRLLDMRRRGGFSADQLAEINRIISVATIRYGMLNHDLNKDIVFSLGDWTARTGNTGVYMLYAYTRTQSILRDIPEPAGAQVNWSLLNNAEERALMHELHRYWLVVEDATLSNSPNQICHYLFDLCQSFSRWYETRRIKAQADPNMQLTCLRFVGCVAKVIDTGLGLLGIKTVDRM